MSAAFLHSLGKTTISRDNSFFLVLRQQLRMRQANMIMVMTRETASDITK